MAENVAVHENGIEIYQQVNGGISFHLTAKENGIRRGTCHTIVLVIFTPVRATMLHNLFAMFTPVRATSLVELYCTQLYNRR
jgi:hypothetical protein